jgi:Leucine-rich repeat (LRR) protein
MNKKFARIIGCLIVFSFALQLSPAAATSNYLDVQGISQNVAPEGDGPETGYPPDFPDERLDPEFEAHFKVEQDRRYQDYLLNADLPEELIARLKMNSEPLEEREYVPPTAEELNQTRVQAESFDCNTVTDVPLTECEALVALYESTNGAGWTNHTNWLETTTAGNWHGVNISSSGHVSSLILYANRLSGAIPEELGSLIGLESLYLSSNQLSGAIPPELGSLTNLHELNLGGNQLSGAIPPELGSLTNLSWLGLYDNQLSGAIPAELGSLTNLQYLYLDSNQLSGAIPPELGSLTNLQHLLLDSNQLSGAIPAELGSLTNLQLLYLYSNQLSGAIPAELGSLTNLWHLYLYSNQLSGAIPPELGSLTNLSWLGLYDNQLSGAIPDSLGSLTNLHALNLGGNQLSGAIPSSLGSLTNLRYLYLYSNQLSGAIPAELGSLTNLQYLLLDSNQLSGAIPAEFGSLTNLQHLYLDSNQLSGEIPTWLGSLTSLQYLDLGWNQLSGEIPTDLGNLLSLKSLNLSNNALSGHVPASFINLVNLCDPDNYDPPCYGYYQLDLGYNHLNVPAPEPLASFLAGKDPDWYLTQAVEVVIQGESGGTLISNDENTEITIPPDAVSGEVTFLFDPQPAPSQATGSLDFAGNSFELTAWDEAEQPVTTFAHPLVITISYDEESLGVIPEISLFLYYWDETQSAWLDAVTTCDGGEYTRNLAEDWLSLPICHLSEFALLGEAYPLFLPLIAR